MADPIGTITDISGTKALIVRADGQRIEAKTGDPIFPGDTVISADSTKVTINLNNREAQGTVTVSSAAQATFSDSLLDSISPLVPSSSEDEPIDIGTPPSQQQASAFREFFSREGSAVTLSTNEQSQSDTIIDLNNLPSPNAGEENNELPDNVLLFQLPIDNGQLNDNPEIIPEIDPEPPQDNPDDPSGPVFDGPPIDPEPPKPPEPDSESTLNTITRIVLIDAIDDTFAATEDIPITGLDAVGNDQVTVVTSSVGTGGNGSGDGGTGEEQA